MLLGSRRILANEAQEVGPKALDIHRAVLLRFHPPIGAVGCFGSGGSNGMQGGRVMSRSGKLNTNKSCGRMVGTSGESNHASE